MAVLKRMLPTAVAIAVGIFILLALFTPIQLFDTIGTRLINTAVIVAAFALFLGVIILIVSMLIVLAIGLLSLPGQPSGPSQPIIQWIFVNIQAPIQASLSALLVFFVITAAYRLLLVRNLE